MPVRQFCIHVLLVFGRCGTHAVLLQKAGHAVTDLLVIVNDEDMRWVRHDFFLSYLFGVGQTHFCHRLYQAPGIATYGYKSVDARPSVSISYADVDEITKHEERL